MNIYMVPHDPNWRQDFAQAAAQITDALGANALTVHHIGSTAIPGIYAKPVLDLLLMVQMKLRDSEVATLDGTSQSASSIQILALVTEARSRNSAGSPALSDP